MKCFLTLLFIFFFQIIHSFSQGFEKRYPYIQLINDMTEMDNGDIVFLGRYRTDYKLGSILFKINSKGDSIFAKDLPSRDLSHIILTKDGGFAIGGSTVNTSPLLIRVDGVGNILWSKDYGGYAQINGVIEKPQGGFLLLESGFKLRDTDANGNPNWHKDLAPGKSYALWDIKESYSGNYICAGNNYNTSTTYYAKINLNGDIIWEKEFSSMLGQTNSVNITSDSGYVMVGNYSGNAGMIKCDSLGNVKNYKKYSVGNTNEFRFGIETSDKGYVFSGVIFTNSVPYMYLVKTDNNGDILWEKKKTFTTNIYDCTIWKVLETKDKKHLLVSGYNDNISYIAMLDREGNTIEPEPAKDNPNGKQPGIVIYPNPYSENSTVLVSSDYPSFNFLLFNSIGQKCKEMKDVTLHHFDIDRVGLGEGIYLYKCYSGNKLIGIGKLMVVN